VGPTDRLATASGQADADNALAHAEKGTMTSGGLGVTAACALRTALDTGRNVTAGSADLGLA
jgi:glucan phosphorylase